MEIDLTSIVIGIAALSIFIIPIGMHEYSHKKNFKKTRNSFYDAAKENDLHISNMDVLRNGYAIGIDSQNQSILHLKNQKETVIKLDNVSSSKLFKNLRGETTDDGNKTFSVILGIHITFKQNRNHDIKLPLFEGIEGSMVGSEEFLIRRWIENIQSVLNTSSSYKH